MQNQFLYPNNQDHQPDSPTQSAQETPATEHAGMDPEPHISIESETTQEHTPVILDGNQISQTAFSSFPDTKYGTVVWQTLLSKPSTSSDSMCVGIATCPSNGTLALHQHSQAEVYYVLEGSGEVEIDGVRHHVKAGTVLWIPGNAMHGAFCGPDETLKWLYVFPEARFEDIIYRFKNT